MLYIRGRSPDARQAWSRRDVLRVGLAAGAGLAGGWPLLNEPALAKPAGAEGKSFGRAKSLVLVYLFGGPSHIDMWDMKPDAPSGIRGEFHPIATSVPGIEITEHLPQLAALGRKIRDHSFADARRQLARLGQPYDAHRPAAAQPGRGAAARR